MIDGQCVRLPGTIDRMYVPKILMEYRFTFMMFIGVAVTDVMFVTETIKFVINVFGGCGVYEFFHRVESCIMSVSSTGWCWEITTWLN